jgi:TolB-like protein/Flp pilus assembly protein TadD
MPSIVSGYEYDIFISYRQKDNKYDGWVTEFVDNLKRELEATFKEEVSVYFDINPHDGLLETHDVNASLKEKLKCLIFIPVISQTYCDTKSFAWQNEFAAFNKIAKEDRYGRDIKLSSGNIASRILPVKIHDLDIEDKTLLENELGGVLRSIDFIYKASGVNRPLKPKDERAENINHIYYRDQINKVANAVKEIITIIKKYDKQEAEPLKKAIKEKNAPGKKLSPKIIIGSFLILAIVALVYFFFPKLPKSSAPIEKSIAVLPFRNLSNDSTQVYFCDGFMEELLNNLQRVEEYTVRPRTSTDQYRKTTKTPKIIGNEMNVNYLIQGSIGMENNTLKIWGQMINTKTNKTIWTNDFKREKNRLFELQSEVAKEIALELKTALTPEETKMIDKKPSTSLEAYNYYLRGNDYYWRSFEKQNYEIASKMYLKAIETDPKFAMAYVRLSLCYLYLNWFYYDKSIDRVAKSKEAIDAVFSIDPDLPEAHFALGYYYYLGLLNYQEALKQLSVAEEKLKNNPDCMYLKANIYRRAGKWTLSEENFKKAFELDPGSQVIALNEAITLSHINNYTEAEEYFNKTLMLNPTFIEAYWQKSFMEMKWKGNTIKARETINDLLKIDESVSDLRIFEQSVIIDIYDGNYQKVLNDLSSRNFDIIDTHFYFNLKSLLFARTYSLMNNQEKARQYYSFALATLESKILKDPEDPRLYSAIGIAYAGLGRKEKAIDAGKRAVDLMPIEKEAYRGVFRVEALARIYVMVGEYGAALEQIKLLLSIPSRLSVKLLLLDPGWKPLWNLPEFKKIVNLTS